MNYHAQSESINYRKSGFLLSGFVAALYALSLFQGMSRPLIAFISAGLFVLAILDAPPLRKAIQCLIKAGNYLHRFTNPLAFGLIYMCAIMPVAIVLRLLRKDVLALRGDSNATTYWQQSEASPRWLFRKQY